MEGAHNSLWLFLLLWRENTGSPVASSLLFSGWGQSHQWPQADPLLPTGGPCQATPPAAAEAPGPHCVISRSQKLHFLLPPEPLLQMAQKVGLSTVV